MRPRSGSRCAIDQNPMPDEYTNLLPPERLRALTRDYYLRLGVVALWLVTALTLVAAVLLVPSFLLVSASKEEKEARLATLSASFATVDEAGLSTRLATLSAHTETLSALEANGSVSDLLRATLLVAHPGITLSEIAYAPATDASPARGGTITLTGIAESRGVLRNYQLALQKAPFAEAANVPVSAYAKDTNIPFIVTLILRP